ncbi:E3 ubiquitin- ligase RNF181 [Pelobates cultripes]|uniref:E3 ubiquitin- ligase RNF181 n=1 Tax=Pelobates cultripes TaxID=61616 RepID=A0AAD1WFS2_PELCU|nr:E3 ubiquitin- ligase RNF181 [Pelobates cultripes]
MVDPNSNSLHNAEEEDSAEHQPDVNEPRPENVEHDQSLPEPTEAQDNELPQLVSAPSGEDNGVEVCCICLIAFSTEKESLRLHCGHRFHTQCILTWLADHVTCPYCRTELF